MEKSKDELVESLDKTNQRLDYVLNRLSDLEELNVIQEYIRLSDEVERLQYDKSKEVMMIQEADMLECPHLFVVLPKEDKSSFEASLYCLKCGVTNSERYVHKKGPSLEAMKKIINRSARNSRIAYSGEVSDLDFAIKKYNELKANGDLDDKKLRDLLEEAITARETKDVRKPLIKK